MPQKFVRIKRRQMDTGGYPVVVNNIPVASTQKIIDAHVKSLEAQLNALERRVEANEKKVEAFEKKPV